MPRRHPDDAPRSPATARNDQARLQSARPLRWRFTAAGVPASPTSSTPRASTVADRVPPSLLGKAGSPAGDLDRRLGSVVFSPGEPLRPTPGLTGADGSPRQFAYPVGYNIAQRPRATESTSFEQLRNLAALYDGIQLFARALQRVSSAAVASRRQSLRISRPGR